MHTFDQWVDESPKKSRVVDDKSSKRSRERSLNAEAWPDKTNQSNISDNNLLRSEEKLTWRVTKRCLLKRIDAMQRPGGGRCDKGRRWQPLSLSLSLKPQGTYF